MWKLRYYVPLLGFVIPTAAIGYGVVIPRSCIAGVNALSLGFASTILGAAMAYVAGIRSATQTGCPASMPWHVRIARYLNRQASAPRGVFGRLLGTIWLFEHRMVNRMSLDLLELEPAHDVVEIGCGPGAALREASRRASSGRMVGLDVSDTILHVAAKRNRAGIASGRVSLRTIDGVDLQLAPESFDRAFAVHSLYFWKDPDRVLAQLFAALRPGGRLVLAFRPESPSIPNRFRDPLYRFYTTAQLTSMLERAGFSRVQEHHAAGAVQWLAASR
jgi:SAM-dependent methyltransferase